MPGRISRPPQSASRKPRTPADTARAKPSHKRKARSLNALSVAEAQFPSSNRVAQHRLGEAEVEEPRRKKARLDEDEDGEDGEDDEEERADAKRLQRKKGRNEDLDVESGEDSEGHEWQMGVVGDDDSDIDSEEAFGSSDEERFDGFTFKGSSGGDGKRGKTGKGKGKGMVNGSVKGRAAIDLNEDEGFAGEDDEDEVFEEEAVDLATMLDEDYESVDEEESADEKKKSKSVDERKSHGESVSRNDLSDDEDDDMNDDDDEAESSDDDDASDISLSEEDDNDPTKLSALRSLAASMAASEPNPSTTTLTKPSQTDSATNAARMLAALKTMPGLDPALSRSVKKLTRSLQPGGITDTPDGVVKVPLPKRQQDRIDRGVAYDKAKETLNRWLDTVKHNRRAEHLSFPLVDPEAQEPQGASQMLPTTTAAPQTELERTIQEIMRASGMGGPGQKSEEEQIAAFEELQANKMPLEEVLARRAELRKARDLMFREERRQKRINKIKSKAYRRVHRKEAERNAQKQRDLMAAAGVELSEDEQEAQDRRRATERMGQRHKESRWAKSVKQTGRAAWDDDARDGVTQMARKNEEIRRRVEGRRVRGEDDSGSDMSEEDEDDEEEDGDSDVEGFRLRKDVDKIQPSAAGDTRQSRLGAMKFMQRADAARKQQNDEAAEQLRKELYNENAGSGEEHEEEVAETSLGRRIFGPTATATAPTKPARQVRDELEEGLDAESDDDRFFDFGNEDETAAPQPSKSSTAAKQTSKQQPQQKEKLQKPRLPAQPFNAITNGHTSEKASSPTPSLDEEATPTSGTQNAKPVPAPNTQGWTTIHYGTTDPSNQPTLNDKPTLPTTNTMAIANDDHNDDDDDDGNDSTNPLIPSNADLVRLAFGTDDDASAFAAEKEAAAATEDTQTISTALPGWGSWTGSGLSKKSIKRESAFLNSSKFTKTVSEGVKPQNRKDTKLKDVIVSEKRVGKNSKYLAETLPFPFESRAMYERSLRVPVGREWNTKGVVQERTKPRVLTKKGRVVEPMSKPMI